MYYHKTVEALNFLVIINNNRIEGYSSASNETPVKKIKNLFGSMAETSRTLNSDLEYEIKKLDGIPLADVKGKGMFSGDRKAMIDSGKYIDGKHILQYTISGENIILKAYHDVLINSVEYLNHDIKWILKKHVLMLSLDRDKLNKVLNIVPLS
jgi:hypothetical protein